MGGQHRKTAREVTLEGTRIPHCPFTADAYTWRGWWRGHKERRGWALRRPLRDSAWLGRGQRTLKSLSVLREGARVLSTRSCPVSLSNSVPQTPCRYGFSLHTFCGSRQWFPCQPLHAPSLPASLFPCRLPQGPEAKPQESPGGRVWARSGSLGITEGATVPCQLCRADLSSPLAPGPTQAPHPHTGGVWGPQSHTTRDTE